MDSWKKMSAGVVLIALVMAGVPSYLAFFRQAQVLEAHGDQLETQERKLEEHRQTLDVHETTLQEHTRKLAEHQALIDNHTQELERQAQRLGKVEGELATLSAQRAEDAARVQALQAEAAALRDEMLRNRQATKQLIEAVLGKEVGSVEDGLRALQSEHDRRRQFEADVIRRLGVLEEHRQGNPEQK